VLATAVAAHAEPAAPVLTIGDNAQKPGETTNVGVLFTPGEAGLRTLAVTFTLPRELEFVKAERGISAEMAGVTVTVTPGAAPEVLLTAEAGAIPAGSLLSVDLKVRSDAAIGSTATVRATAGGVSTAGAKVEVDVESGDVEITSASPSTIACFFYMH
jgi:hypothetical protein